MTPSLTFARAALLGVAAAVAASFAQARNDVFMAPVAAVTKKPRLREITGDLPLRWGESTATDATSPNVLRAESTVEGSASATGEDPRRHEKLSDDTVCLRAFEDALARLVAAARDVHAGAIVGIVSAYKGSAVIGDGKSFECHAGLAHSHVFLRAQLLTSLPAVPTSGFPPASGFAALEDADAVPVSEKGKDRYRHFLTLATPRAFVVFEDGRWYMSAHDPEAMSKALDYCARVGTRCWLYAVDDRVVWRADVSKRISASAQLRAAVRAASEADE